MFAENLNPEKSGQHEPEEGQTKDIGICHTRSSS